MIPQNLAEITHQVKLLTQEVGDFVGSSWRNEMQIIEKDIADYQSNIDIEAEKRFAAGLKIILPEADVQGEEIFIDNPSNKLKFVIDPIDGTRFFVSNAPSFCCQVALVYEEEPIISTIYLPVSKQLFSSYQGGGSFLDGKKLEISHQTELERTIVLAEWGNVEKNQFKWELISTLADRCKRLYCGTGGIVPFVATRTYDAYVRIHNHYKIYDLAPRILIWKEAGAKVEMFDVGDTQVMIAANPILFKKIKQILTQ